jgi:NADPH:quinone reductase-like Zn-dependent oxidoreductase
MKAAVCSRYGPPEVLRLTDVEKPELHFDEVLVRVHAANVSVSDCVIRSGRVKPIMWLPFRLFVGFRRPRHAILGVELSGEVEKVGLKVRGFKPGDQIIAFTGRHFGAYAEYVCLREGGRYMPFDCLLERKPANISHAEAATIPSRATIAMYFLNQAAIKQGQRVLIYGASGGIGTFAVQLAKDAGAVVTGVCSATNVDLVRTLGADFVLDYTDEKISDVGGPYDIFFDAAGSAKRSDLKSRCLAALVSGGKPVSVDTAAKVPAQYLSRVTELITAGKVRPFLDKTFPLARIAEAHRYVEAGHKRGGVVVAMEI